MPGFNIDYIRNLNKVHFFTSEVQFGKSRSSLMEGGSLKEENFSQFIGDAQSGNLSENPEEYFDSNPIFEVASEYYNFDERTDFFEAYLSSGISFNFNIQYANLLGGGGFLGGGERLTWGNLASFLLSKINAPVGVDMDRVYIFKGVDAIKMNLDCFLYVKDSWDTDVVQPLNKFIEYILPSRGPLLAKMQSDVVNALKEAANDAKYEIYKMAQDAARWSLETIGPVFDLRPPKWMNSIDRVGFYVGSPETPIFKLDSIQITSVNFSIPPLIYESGYPPYVKLTIGVESTRVTTMDNFRFQ